MELRYHVLRLLCKVLQYRGYSRICSDIHFYQFSPQASVWKNVNTATDKAADGGTSKALSFPLLLDLLKNYVTLQIYKK